MYIDSYLNLLMNQRQNSLQSISYRLWMNLRCFQLLSLRFSLSKCSQQSTSVHESFQHRLQQSLPICCTTIYISKAYTHAVVEGQIHLHAQLNFQILLTEPIIYYSIYNFAFSHIKTSHSKEASFSEMPCKAPTSMSSIEIHHLLPDAEPCPSMSLLYLPTEVFPCCGNQPLLQELRGSQLIHLVCRISILLLLYNVISIKF